MAEKGLKKQINTSLEKILDEYPEDSPEMAIASDLYDKINDKENPVDESHIRQFIAALESLCRQTWPVITSNASDIEKIVAAALEKCEGDELVAPLAESIRSIINDTTVKPPVFNH